MLFCDIKEGVSVKSIKRFKQMVENQEDLHQRAFCLPFFEVKKLVTEIEDEFAQLSWAESVSAPKDADGKIIPLDTTELYTDDGKTIIVGDIRFNGYSWNVKNMDSDKLYFVGALHLAQPDNWEKLEEDVQKASKTDDICGYFDKSGESCDGCPASDISDVCSAIVLRDILRRAKALAGEH